MRHTGPRFRSACALTVVATVALVGATGLQTHASESTPVHRSVPQHVVGFRAAHTFLTGSAPLGTRFANRKPRWIHGSMRSSTNLAGRAAQAGQEDDDLYRTLVALIRRAGAGILEEAKGRLAVALTLVTVLLGGLGVSLFMSFKRQAARALQAQDQAEAVGRKLRDLDRARMDDD